MAEAVGIVGLGNAGGALASALCRQMPVVGFDVDPARRAAVADLGLTLVDSVEAVARSAPAVILSLPRPEISTAVVAAIAGERPAPRVVIETSTVTPGVARALGATCAAAGIGFVDAAIAGGVQSMAAGQVTFLAGGSDADMAAAAPVLEALAERVHHLGPVGAGSGAKVVNNAVMHALMVVLVEAAAMGEKLAIAPEKLVEILGRPDGIMRPLEHRLRDRVLAGNYEGGMSMANARKDSLLALETAQDLGVPLFATLAAHTPYEIATARGMGNLDYAALARLWEEWCGITLSR
ncbi:MAG: NAD(P)-dependent oxidoreductase [Ectothiorhodospiraceae bacterium]|nr:NAD(P)-dependent oxidoreductase [Chromatiales bacterium]MCP5153583.1 NAD(P)-dependent oxidoreductase [Ectothiorhodospiraceae bacterium]